jgi:archaemetzincin
MTGLDLVPIQLPRQEKLVERLAATLEQVFRVPVRIRRCWFDVQVAYDSYRGQYSSTQLLRELLSERRHRAKRILGVTGVDLFIPVLTYVFGEAQVNGPAAVVSMQRLRSEAYGLPPDEELLAERLEKEAIHELGHTFGLLHCAGAGCVMHSSTYVEEIDLKEGRFCEPCLLQLVDGVGQATAGGRRQPRTPEAAGG